MLLFCLFNFFLFDIWVNFCLYLFNNWDKCFVFLFVFENIDYLKVMSWIICLMVDYKFIIVLMIIILLYERKLMGLFLNFWGYCKLYNV